LSNHGIEAVCEEVDKALEALKEAEKESF